MDREIRLLHTADTHLGYRQYHSDVRRQDFFKAFEIVINDAVDMQVDAVVHAGDLFDSRNPTLEDLLETMSILSRLKSAGIPFFGIVGNHESKQNTQWLDLFEEMGLSVRLGKKPQILRDRNGRGDSVAIYGIDSVPKSKIPVFDYSGFEAPENCISVPESCRKLIVMHQIVQPFPYAEWDCAEVIEKLPFKVDAILLGDYHKYEKIKIGDAWVTYPGSTERNSASENEPRSYNIITLSNEGMEISRRTIPTRHFLNISVILNGEEKPFEQIFSAINERLEELPESVTFLEISGDSSAVLSLSEIEDYLLSKGVLVPRVKDLRIKESLPEDALKVAFSDPDHAVANEIKRLSLNDGGLIVDEIVRNPDISRSRVDEETESRLSKLIEAIDFNDPNFTIEILARSDEEINQAKDLDPSVETEFEQNIGSKASELSEMVLKDSRSISDSDFISQPQLNSKVLSAPSHVLTSESPSESPSASSSKLSQVSDSEISSLSASESSFESCSKSVSENVFKESFSPDAPEFPAGSPDKIIEPQLQVEEELSEISKKRLEKEVEIPESTIESEIKSISEENEVKGEKTGNLPDKVFSRIQEEKSGIRVSEITSKTLDSAQKAKKGKTAVPRQYNLGDYL